MKLLERIKDGFFKAERKVKMAVMTMSLTLATAFPAFATDTGTEGVVKDFMNKGLDFIFNIASVGIGVTGIFSLFLAAFKFFNATQARDGEQQREAGSAIGVALMIIAMAAAIFVLKSPVNNLINTLFTS